MEKRTYNREIAAIIKYNNWVNRRINYYTGAGVTILFAVIYWLTK